MPLDNPQMSAEKWARNTGASTEAYKRGVDLVQESPMEKAANNTAAYIAGVQRAVDSGKFQASLRRVPLSVWKDKTKTVGAQRLAAGAAAAKPKMENFMRQFFPHLAAGMASLPPRGTLDQNLARADRMARHNAEFRMGG